MLQAADWSADGKFVLYSAAGKKTGADLWVLPMGNRSEESKPFPFLQTPANESEGQFSPDGRWVAYTSDESGKDEVYVQSFPSGGSKRQISANGGSDARWRSDGHEIYYVTRDLRLMATPVKIGTTLEAGVPTMLFQGKGIGFNRATPGNAKPPYDVSADGKRFIVRAPPQASSTPSTVVLNWTELLKK
jgi:dipeptidyl aminopeptidase/acylaminoacyl peptidase